MLLKKNIKIGKIKSLIFLSILFLFLIFPIKLNSESDLEGNFTSIKILDKISSKNILIKLKNKNGVKKKYSSWKE